VDEKGQVKISSYINNLHPEKHKEMYKTIGSIFENFVPLFENVLTDLLQPPKTRIDIDSDWYEPQQDGEDDDEYYDNRLPRPQKIKEFQNPEPPKQVVDLKGRRLQVIVKLANIILTPENPRYNGGSWHVEGMKNENIVASGIYYYVSQNISESILNFRQAVHQPDYEQSDDKGVAHIYGLANEAALSQEMGGIITQEDRCIAFPNLFQHQVAPFELVDKSKPGYRKILVFFLVDPSVRVQSTLHVPPQQRHWMIEILCKIFKTLPKEVVALIVGFMDWPMDLASAKIYRGELMEERKFFIKENNSRYFERPFSLCEH
jgi:hypothetical protein